MPEVRSPPVYGVPDGAEGRLNLVRRATSELTQVFQMSGGKLPGGGVTSGPFGGWQPAWNGLRFLGSAARVEAKPLTVWGTAAGPRSVQVTVSPARTTIADGKNSLMDNRPSGLPIPAATCQVFVPSGFDASDGLLIRSWEANQVRSAWYWRWASPCNSAADCTG